MKILLTSDRYIPAVNGVVTSVRNLKRGLEAQRAAEDRSLKAVGKRLKIYAAEKSISTEV